MDFTRAKRAKTSLRPHILARSEPGAIKTLFALAWPERGLLAVAALCMAVSAVATAGYAYLVGPVLRSLFLGTDAGFNTPAPGVLSRLSAEIGAQDPWLIGAAITVAAAVKGASYFGHTALSGKAGQKVLHGLRAKMFESLLSINPLDPSAGSRGKLISCFTIDVEAVESSVSQGLIAFVRDSLQIVALAGLALALDPLLGLVGLVAFPPAAVLIVRIGRQLKVRRKKVHSAYGDMSSVVDETVAGLAVIRSFGAEEMMGGRFERQSTSLFRATVRAIVLKAISSPANELLGASALALTLWYAHSRISAGAISPEAFVSFFSALFLLYQPVKGLGRAQHAVQSGLAALERLTLLAPVKPQPRAASIQAPPQNPKEIRLGRAEAGYGDGSSVLTGVDLTIQAGSKIAVVGKSGQGKTTLLYLLQGFLPLRSGELLVDGQPVEPTPSLARELFAPVPQEPYLFNDSIRMNVRCGRPVASDAEVEAACKAAGVHQFAQSLLKGIDTRVGSGGRELSQGQRQRVCLARALVSRAPVLLLDEVTASLDGETEQALVEELNRYLINRTILIVTHRLSTARWADKVALLEDGVVRALGPSREMLDQNERLAELFGEQDGAGCSL